MSETPRSPRIRTRSSSKRVVEAGAGPGHGDVDQIGDHAAVEHGDPVGEEDRLLDVVGDEHDGEAALAPQPA